VSNASSAMAHRLIAAAAATIRAHEQELNALDSLVGDGDHGLNFAVALTSAAARPPADCACAVFRNVEETLAAEMGGAAGVIFGAFFGGIGRAAETVNLLTASGYALALQSALTDVKRWGKASPGDKTLVDALAPATIAATQSAAEQATLAETARHAATAARAGAEGTRSMEARRGRARFLGSRAVGHADAGATSLALILETWAEILDAEILDKEAQA